MAQKKIAQARAEALARSEFTEEVKKYLPARHHKYVQQLLSARLAKVAPYLIGMKLMVQPQGRTWSGFYEPEAAVIMAAFIRWQGFGVRRSFYQVAGFFEQLRTGTGWYEHLSDEEKQMLARFVHAKPVLRLVKTA